MREGYYLRGENEIANVVFFPLYPGVVKMGTYLINDDRFIGWLVSEGNMLRNYFIQIIFIIFPILIGGILFIFSLKKDYFSFLNRPIDFGYKIFGKRLFGDNKTFRGVLLMPLYVALVVFLLGRLLGGFNFNINNLVFDYGQQGVFFGLFYGLAYSLGELPNSFIKRQLDINPGGQPEKQIQKRIFIIIDDTDSLFACSLVLLLLYRIDFSFIIGAFLLGVVLHFLTDILMKKNGLK